MNLLSFKCGVIVIAIVLLSACKIRPPITADYDTQYNFKQLKRYAWIKPADASKVSTLDNRRQINAIETILNRKGFSKAVGSQVPDFLLKTHTVTDKKTDVDSYYRAWGYHPFPFHQPFGWPHNGTMTVVREYEMGTLVLDIVDSVKKEIIWRGSVSRKLGIYENRTPDERDTIALLNAEYLLESFPPGRAIVE